MNQRKVLVTGIGGNVGQGILRNIRAIDSSIKLVGTNITEFSPGNYLCDKVYKIPYSYDSGFISAILSICDKEKIDLIIPSTDFEALYLSEKRELLPTLATSEFKTNSIFTDKYFTFLQFLENDIRFANSILPSEYNKQFFPIILKPRKGRGSRGIFINPTDLSKFNDDEYMVQELAEGTEITTAFYVTKDNLLHGHITMERKLENGTTVLSLVTSKYDNLVVPVIQKMMGKFIITGSCNIQSIVNKNGELIPFEINGRISGTNSIRSNFGFEDVKYTLEEYLFKSSLSECKVRPGAATRILLDVIYPGITEWNQLNETKSENYLF